MRLARRFLYRSPSRTPRGGVAITPDGSNVYVGSDPQTSTTDPGVVSVIDTTTNPNKEIATIAVDRGVRSIAITPDGSKAYVTTAYSVAVIDTQTKAVIATIPIPIMGPIMGLGQGIAITPDGSKAYVATGSPYLGVIDTATNTVGSPINVGGQPYDLVIQPVPSPVPSFAGTPRTPSCHGDSISALTHKFGSLARFAKVFGVSVREVQQRVAEFCND